MTTTGAELGRTNDPRALIPGDPNVWHAYAQALSAQSDGHEQIGDQLRRLDWSQGWSGLSSDAAEAMLPRIAKVRYDDAETMADIASAMTVFAYSLQAAQRQAAEAIELFHSGQVASEVARRRYDQAAREHARPIGSGAGRGAQGMSVRFARPPMDPFVDPGEPIRQQAQQILAGARAGLSAEEQRAVAAVKAGDARALAASIWAASAPSAPLAGAPTTTPSPSFDAEFNEMVNALRGDGKAGWWIGMLDKLLYGIDSGTYSLDQLIRAMRTLSDEDAMKLNEYLGGCKQTNDTASRLSSMLMAGAASAAEVNRFLARFPALEPTLTGSAAGWRTGSIDLTTISPDDIHQGSIGDCWFIAGLGAVAVANPELLMRNIRQNANGTYTVTLYPDGNPQQVTVSAQVPVSRSGGAAYASDGASGANWVSIYEKAAAQLIAHGQYAGLVAGMPSTGLAVITGGPVENFGPIGNSISIEDIKSMIADHRPMSAISLVAGAGSGAASWHVYYVSGVTDDGRVIVQNPWGHGDSQGGIDQTLCLTIEEFRRTFNWSSAGE